LIYGEPPQTKVCGGSHRFLRFNIAFDVSASQNIFFRKKTDIT